MTIREYFDSMISAATFEELDAIWEMQENLYELYEDDYDAFEAWAAEQDIDLTVVDERIGVLVLTTWAWDMCGE